MLCLRCKPLSSASADHYLFSASSSLSSLSSASASVSPDVDALQDCISVMRHQEDEAYKCNDYLLRRRIDCLSTTRETSSVNTQQQQVGGETVDVTCREKMAEWSYRIVDHFHGNREIVAISFNMLDRFLDRCCCDRTAFKLAAITSLYISIKLYSSKQVSIESLSRLSRGEFDVKNIAEMETILLKTLDFRLHGPTSQKFIDHMMTLLSQDIKEGTRRIIGQRAHFFAELAVLDYSLSIESPSSLAFAAIMNAAEGFENHSISYDESAIFLMAVENATKADFQSQKMCIIRDRLWHLYETSEEFKVQGAVPSAISFQGQQPLSMTTSHTFNEKAGAYDNGQSPVSVLLETGCQLR
mmetsp:Transcript_25408/g.51741  ORF Transcript_25408/g.51741 Transcript_25408/m.51741 type:complete len:356 (+) Transcript_25408:630-1697(+)